jgi:hypothetical protein
MLDGFIPIVENRVVFCFIEGFPVRAVNYWRDIIQIQHRINSPVVIFGPVSIGFVDIHTELLRNEFLVEQINPWHGAIALIREISSPNQVDQIP